MIVLDELANEVETSTIVLLFFSKKSSQGDVIHLPLCLKDSGGAFWIKKL
jgi:hypothetical protein